MSKRYYKLNEDYFNVIDTEAKAYWLGYIYADGGITIGRPWVVQLQSKDKWFLDNIKSAMQAENPIKNITNGSGFTPGTKHYRLNLYSKKLSTTLFNWKGISEEINMPNIDKHLKRHFIRGFFDGDGSVYTWQKKGVTKHKGYTYKLADGTKKFVPYNIPREYPYSYEAIECDIICCNNMQEDIVELLKLANIKTRIKKSKSEHMNYVVVTNKPAVKRFYEYLYTDATIYLPRKHKVFTTHYAP